MSFDRVGVDGCCDGACKCDVLDGGSVVVEVQCVNEVVEHTLEAAEGNTVEMDCGVVGNDDDLG